MSRSMRARREIRIARALSRAALFAADTAAPEPPREFLIWPFGMVKTTRGDFELSRETALAVIAAYERQGNELPIDYEHASLGASDARDPAEAGKAAGWFRPELRDDGLWATAVRWTDAAAAKLRAKEYRYFSPAFALSKDGGILELINLALTNLPATAEQEALMAASKSAAVQETGMDRHARDRRTEAAFGKMSFDECRKMVQAALDAKYPPPEDAPFGGPYIGELYDDAAIVEMPDGKCLRVPYAHTDGAVTLGEPEKVRRTWEPMTQGESPAAPEEPKPPAEPMPMSRAECAEVLALAGKPTAAEALVVLRERLAPPPAPAPELPEAARVALARVEAEKTALAQRVLTLERADKRRAILSRVEAFKALAGSEHEALADDLLALAEHDPKLATRTEERFRLASAAVVASGIIQPLSAPASEPAGGSDPRAEVARRVVELRAADPKLTDASAYILACKRDPALYAAIRAAEGTAGSKVADDAD